MIEDRHVVLNKLLLLRIMICGMMDMCVNDEWKKREKRHLNNFLIISLESMILTKS